MQTLQNNKLGLDSGRMFTARDRIQDRQNLLCDGKKRIINLAWTVDGCLRPETVYKMDKISSVTEIKE